MSPSRSPEAGGIASPVAAGPGSITLLRLLHLHQLLELVFLYSDAGWSEFLILMYKVFNEG